MSVALIGAMTERFSATHRANIVEHLTPDNLQLMDRLKGMGAVLSSTGTDISRMTTQTYALLSYSIQKEAMILSYIDIFRYFVILIVISLPIVLIAKNYKVDPSAKGGGH